MISLCENFFFPPLEEYNKQLQKNLENEWLTNRGIYRRIRRKVKEIPYGLYYCNE
jgi:hypothetical protein